jgi:AcrR family transcriptional regulator
VQRTKSSLHSALIGLAREKPYPAIAVKEILNRANVGRSTFYTHFRDKDDLLESGIHEVLRSARGGSHARSAVDRLLAFSLPILTHIDEHRHAAGPQMKREGRLVMHARLAEAVKELIADDLALLWPKSKPPIPVDLLAQHVASTFVLVLNWWLENSPTSTPADADAHFRELILPTLRGVVVPIA